MLEIFHESRVNIYKEALEQQNHKRSALRLTIQRSVVWKKKEAKRKEGAGDQS